MDQATGRFKRPTLGVKRCEFRDEDRTLLQGIHHPATVRRGELVKVEKRGRVVLFLRNAQLGGFDVAFKASQSIGLEVGSQNPDAGAAAIPSIRTSRMDFILGWRIVLRYGRAAGDKLRRYRTGYPATRRRRRAEAGSDSPWPGTGSMWTRRQWQFQG